MGSHDPHHGQSSLDTETEGCPIQVSQPDRGYALQAERSKQRRVHFFKRSLSGGDGSEGGGGGDGGGGQGGEGGRGEYPGGYASILVHGPGSELGR